MPRRRRQRTNWLLLTKKIKLINKIYDSKPSPVLGEGGPRQWWVREFCEWKSEEIEQFEVAPHPAFGHLLPDGEG